MVKFDKEICYNHVNKIDALETELLTIREEFEKISIDLKIRRAQIHKEICLDRNFSNADLRKCELELRIGNDRKYQNILAKLRKFKRTKRTVEKDIEKNYRYYQISKLDYQASLLRYQEADKKMGVKGDG